MKSIIFDCDLMKYPHTGLHRYCLNLGRHLQSLASSEQSAQMAYYVPPAAKGTFGPDAKEIVEKKSVWNFFRPYLKNCDVWHAPFQSGRIIPDKKKHPDIRILLTIHDLNTLHEGKPPEEQRANLAHTQSLISRADAIVCVSDFTRRDVMKNCDVGRKPVYVVYNGRNELHPPSLEIGSYRPHRPYLFGIGYLNRKKNYDVLLPLLKENEDIELLIAGHFDDPDYARSMHTQAEEWGIADRLKLTGPVSETEKSWYLENCMAFVHPSLAEGFGLPVIEAMSVGRPVFVSDKTALPEIGGDVAFYFSSFEPDHMQEVFSEGMRTYNSNGLSDRLRARSEEFTWRKSASEYLSIYNNL